MYLQWRILPQKSFTPCNTASQYRFTINKEMWRNVAMHWGDRQMIAKKTERVKDTYYFYRIDAKRHLPIFAIDAF